MDTEFLQEIMTPDILKKRLEEMKASNVPKELIAFIKDVAEKTRLAREQGLISDEDFAKFVNREKV